MENEQELQGQDYQDMEGAPENQDERVDIDDGDGQESSEDPGQEIGSVVGKLQQDFDEKFRNFQSVKDREMAELKGQLKQTIELLNNKGGQNQEQDITSEYFDEDGYAKDINAKDVAKIVQDAIKKDREYQDREYQQQAQQQTEKQQQQQSWINSQSDSEDVIGYYGENQKKLESKMRQQGVDSNDYRQAYLFVKSELRQKKLEEKQKPNTPPVGNQGSNFASRSPARNKSPMQQAMESASNKTLGFLN